MRTFTEFQKRAIDAQGNVLVSAGAGTGKTGTVVARCLRLILEERCPVENILMVTFTEAAAAEMRARLRKELERARDGLIERASSNSGFSLPSTGRGIEGEGWERSRRIAANSAEYNQPPLTPALSPLRGEGETHCTPGSLDSSAGCIASLDEIEEQLALLDTAHISTLHGFGLQLVREHFHELGIDPQVNVLDESQTQPLIHNTLDALLENCYEGRSPMAPAVLALIRNYGGGSEEKIRALVLKLHRYTQTLPRPEIWTTAQLDRLAQPEPVEWRDLFVQAVCDWRAEFAEEVQALNACDNVAACVRALKECHEEPTFAQAADAVRCVTAAYEREWVRGTVGKYRDPLKKFFERAQFLASLVADSADVDPMIEDWNRMREPMRALLELTRAFTQEFARAKRALGGIDFSDIEQFALACLVDPDGKPTVAARKWQEKFTHVFVDEYQDINAAQDAILSALSRDGERANRFLVGDVKQSIYRFRLADPTIFRAYEEHWRAGQEGQRIPLADNFRSRERILDFVNPLFAEMMRPELGGIHYDADAQLRFGNPEARDVLSAKADPAPRVELHVIHDGDAEVMGNNGEEEADESDEAVDVDSVELEARLIARRLRELRDRKHSIWDAEAKCLREVDWKDMVVLLRSPGPRIEGFAKEFSRAGVPLAAARAGFFSAIEVCDLLNALRLLDNPRQDIPLVAVLRSPLFGFSADELAIIRAVAGRDGEFFAALNRFHYKAGIAAPGSIEESARKKVQSFRRSFEKWRRLMRHTSLSQCLETILAETQYEALSLASERGRERTANVQRLLELARSYDPYQRQGLFRFLKFVEQQEETGLDQDVAVVDTGNAVRLMSIHGSKGLEFPVVALACLGGQFNQTDLRQDILLSPSLGLCAKIVCPNSERRYPSLLWWFAKQIEHRELLGEELRLLYVAMTRARDTLVLTAFDGTREGESPWESGRMGAIDTRELLAARSYWHWLKLWLARVTQPGDWQPESVGRNDLLAWRRWTKPELASEPAWDTARSAITANDADAVLDTDALRARLTWTYPHSDATREPAKTNVSVLRRRATEEDGEARQLFYPRSGARRGGELSAAQIGSAHHLFMQHVAFAGLTSLLDLRDEAQRLVQENHLTLAEAASLNFEALFSFWNSEEGRRLVSKAPFVHRELPFTARFTPNELQEMGLGAVIPRADEFVIVQGIVDLAVISPEGIEILDFKTDDVRGDILAAKGAVYAPQLRMYAAALRAIYGRPVRKAALHFLAAGETLAVKVD